MPHKKKMHRVSLPGKLDANKTQIARQLRAKNRWARKSRTHRKNNPLCCDPFGNHKEEQRVVVVKDVHHVVPVAKDPTLAFVSSNLRSLCRKCHNQITAMEKAGKPTEHLFHDDGEGGIIAPEGTKQDRAVIKELFLRK
jgi:5-methylcytosine-specific restriction endonuclease McrA